MAIYLFFFSPDKTSLMQILKKLFFFLFSNEGHYTNFMFRPINKFDISDLVEVFWVFFLPYKLFMVNIFGRGEETFVHLC